MERQKIRELISQMTIEEKAGFCTGKDFWHLRGVERLGIPSVLVSDGPHGLRKQIKNEDHLGLSDSITAICFPAGCAIASSFSREAVRGMGEEYGSLAHAEDVSVVLGPAINMKRSPLCGRNFEYYSEDPHLSSQLAVEYVKGVQSKHVGACPKHFAANNQEYRRMTSNSVVDERTLREIYLAAFEDVVKEGKPWSVMSSYNKLNGTYTSEHPWLLTEVLRKEWGFDGFVVSDWGAADDPVASADAGLNVEMPGPGPDSVKRIAEAVKNGTLAEEKLDALVEQMLEMRYRYLEHRNADETYDYEHGHAVAKKLAEESAVLLKNDGGVLPLDESEKVLLVGEFAKVPRYQGGGSSHIHSYKISSVYEEVKDNPNISYVQGYAKETDEALLAEAVEAAKKADKVVIFAGLPEEMESEGFDRKHLEMPQCQNQLIQAVAEVQPDTIVVLHNGSPVAMPWADQVKGILELYLGGEAVGEAAADLLYGKVNPSGRLAETFPLRVEDTPCYPYFGKEKEDVVYREGSMIGYRHYVTRKIPVQFPFGYGLSYSKFVYMDLVLDKESMKDTEQLIVSVDVTNISKIAGKEVVQLYVAADYKNVVTPARELRAFDKISLEPGEKKTVRFTLDKRAFAYWNEEIGDWEAPSGTYKIQIGRSAENMILEKEIHLTSTTEKKPVFTRNSAMGDILLNEKGGKVVMELLASRRGGSKEEREKDNSSIMSQEALAATMDASPLRSLLTFNPNATAGQLEKIVRNINAAVKEEN